MTLLILLSLRQEEGKDRAETYHRCLIHLLDASCDAFDALKISSKRSSFLPSAYNLL